MTNNNNSNTTTKNVKKNKKSKSSNFTYSHGVGKNKLVYKLDNKFSKKQKETIAEQMEHAADAGYSVEERQIVLDRMKNFYGKSRLDNPARANGYIVNPDATVPQESVIPVAPVLVPGALHEYASFVSILATANGIGLGETINVDGTLLGVNYMAVVWVMYNLHLRTKNERALIDRCPKFLALALNMLTPRTVKHRIGPTEGHELNFAYLWTRPSDFLGSGGIYPSGISVVPGRHSKTSVGWIDNSAPNDGLDNIFSLTPNLTNEQVLEYGPIAYADVMSRLNSIYNWDYVNTADFNLGLSSPAAFASVVSTTTKNAQASDGVFGKVSLEVPIGNKFAAFAYAGFADASESEIRRDSFIRVGFLGMHGLFHNIMANSGITPSEGLHHNEFILTNLDFCTVLHIVTGMLLIADIYHSEIERSGPNRDRYVQNQDRSVLFTISEKELLFYTLACTLNMFKIPNFVAVFSHEESVAILTGSQFSLYADMGQCEFFLSLVERFGSMQPMVAAATKRGLDGKRYVRYCSLILRGKTGCIPANNAIPGAAKDFHDLTLLLGYVEPNLDIANCTYEFSDYVVAPYVGVIDPFDYSVSYTTGDAVPTEILTYTNEVLNRLQAEINLTIPYSSHQSNRTLLCYAKWIAIDGVGDPVDQSGFSQWINYDLRSISSDLPWQAEETGMINIGVGPEVYIRLADGPPKSWYAFYLAGYHMIIGPNRKIDAYMSLGTWFSGTANDLVHSRWVGRQQGESEKFADFMTRRVGGTPGIFADTGGIPQLLMEIAGGLVGQIPVLGPILSGLIPKFGHGLKNPKILGRVPRIRQGKVPMIIAPESNRKHFDHIKNFSRKIAVRELQSE